jgi:hypothetical protein
MDPTATPEETAAAREDLSSRRSAAWRRELAGGCGGGGGGAGDEGAHHAGIGLLYHAGIGSGAQLVAGVCGSNASGCGEGAQGMCSLRWTVLTSSCICIGVVRWAVNVVGGVMGSGAAISILGLITSCIDVVLRMAA